ncbi:MAG: helix-turn-helix transcriptional regulator [Pedobacter sp.]|nr:MAG: helix-turn-helix transcriptional regulator [Pedobacter sp.]
MKISSAVKYKLSQNLHVNIDWLENGLGEPFLTTGPLVSEGVGVPYYNINLSETSGESLKVMEEKPDYFVNYRPFNDCAAYLPVYGDSMYPKYASGEIIAVKEIINLDVIQWGEAYVVMTGDDSNNLRTIKILHEHIDANKIILRSSNPNFKGDTVIKKKDIVALYIIKGKITRNMI